MPLPLISLPPHFTPRSGKEEVEKNVFKEREKIREVERGGRGGRGSGKEILHSSLAVLIAQ